MDLQGPPEEEPDSTLGGLEQSSSTRASDQWHGTFPHHTSGNGSASGGQPSDQQTRNPRGMEEDKHVGGDVYSCNWSRKEREWRIKWEQ